MCAVLSKSVCVLLPVGFLLLDALVFAKLHPAPTVSDGRRIARDIAHRTAHKLPFFAALLVFAAVALWSNEHGAKVDTDVLCLTHSERLLKALVTPAWVARQLLWPARLRVHYQLRDGDLNLIGNLENLLSVVALALCVGIGVWRMQQRQSPQLLLGLLYFCLMLLPVSGLIQHGIATQGSVRYAYFPSMVFVPLGGRVLGQLCFGADNQGEALKPSKHLTTDHQAECNNNRAKQRIAVVTAGRVASRHKHRVFAVYAAALCALLRISTLQMETWRNEKALYAHSLRCASCRLTHESWYAGAEV